MIATLLLVMLSFIRVRLLINFYIVSIAAWIFREGALHGAVLGAQAMCHCIVGSVEVVVGRFRQCGHVLASESLCSLPSTVSSRIHLGFIRMCALCYIAQISGGLGHLEAFIGRVQSLIVLIQQLVVNLTNWQVRVTSR